jgi:flagellin
MLSLVNNIASQIAQNNLSNANNSLNVSLQRLSSGLAINSGADNPAGLVISQEQMAQMSGLQTAITNTSKATNVVQIADGALNETNSLLLQIRGLAVDAANAGANDPNTLAADQAQIANALQTISRIATSTQFGNEKLLDGSHAAATTSTNTGYTATNPGSLTTGNYTVAITSAGSAATVVGGTASNTGNAETLTINGVQIAIAANSSVSAMANDINAYTSQTGVTAAANGTTNLVLYATTFGSGHTISVSASSTSDATGLTGSGATSTDGTDIQGTINGQVAEGVGNTLYATAGAASGLSVTVATNSSGTYANQTLTNGTTIQVNAENALLFQIGADSGQSASLSIQAMTADNLGLNATGNTSTTMVNLSQINVMNPANASNVLAIIDKAIKDVANTAGTLGAFQDNTLQATAANLQTSLQNTTAANSTIRDTNFATETANYTQAQVLVQAGTMVLKNANQIPQMALTLLQ